MKNVRYLRRVEQLKNLTPSERKTLGRVTERYSFRANDYYLSLADWDNPDDPIRKIIVPQEGELEPFGDLDASNESTNYVAPGCQHKYHSTALLICTEMCGSFCRFCFRKRLFMDDNDEAVVDVSEGIEYIRQNPQITNVLLSGGDPLFLSSRRLDDILTRLRDIPHVGIIRIGSKMPAFNPYRIINDPELCEVLSRHSSPEKRIYVMVHFNVPQELTPAARRGIDLLIRSGAILCNQTPLLKGINDRPEILAELMRQLSFMGVPPYYFFMCRPTEGNKPFALSLVESYQLLEEAKLRESGLAKRARLVMSHESGKVEMVGMTRNHMYLRYHRARNAEDKSRFMIFHRDNDAYWLDDLVPVAEAPHPVSRHGHRAHFGIGPE
ncbi:MAG: KamA family radical SAM protein [bacterium]|nr:KamA family radical SAM protein [bacterium]